MAGEAEKHRGRFGRVAGWIAHGGVYAIAQNGKIYLTGPAFHRSGDVTEVLIWSYANRTWRWFYRIRYKCNVRNYLRVQGRFEPH